MTGLRRSDTLASLHARRQKSTGTGKKKIGKSFKKRLRSLDQFQESFQFQLPNGQKTLPSYVGAFFSSVMMLLLFTYGGLELITLWTNANSTITTNEVDSFFDGFYEFDLDKKPGL